MTTWPGGWLLVTTMALTNAEKQARWRERHAMKRYAVQRNTSQQQNRKRGTMAGMVKPVSLRLEDADVRKARPWTYPGAAVKTSSNPSQSEPSRRNASLQR